MFRIGEFTITSFGLMMFVSFVVGAWATSKALARYGLEPELIWNALPWIAIAGIIGARVYYLALHWQDLLANPRGELLSRGNLVWYGGLIGGVVAYYAQIRKRKLPLAVMFDATAPALMLAIAIGRVGCFLVGDDYGMFTEGPFGIAFPEGIPPSTAGYLRSIGDSIPATIADSTIVRVHPTQIYEVVITLILSAFLWQVSKSRVKPGQLFSAFLIMYAVERFFIEILRAKSDRFVAGLSTSQLLSIALIIAGVLLWWRQKSKPSWNPEQDSGRVGFEPKPKSA